IINIHRYMDLTNLYIYIFLEASMKRVIAMILIFTVILGGCSSKDKNSPVDKDIYRFVYSGEIGTLNYLTASSSNEFGVVANLIDTLVDYDKYGVIQPALATGWYVSEDRLTWTFKIREGVSWVTYDGKEYGEVTAQDFVDSMEYILDSRNRSLTANIAYSVIKNGEKYYKGEIKDFSQVGVKTKDKYILEYTLEKPVPYFLSMMTYVCFFPVNGEFLKEVGDGFGTDKDKILYNGAYVMDIFEPQYKRVLSVNDKYWDRDNIHIKKIIGT